MSSPHPEEALKGLFRRARADGRSFSSLLEVSVMVKGV